MHASYPESHLLMHCSRDSCANRSLGVSVPASLDVTPDNHTRRTTTYLMALSSLPLDSLRTKGIKLVCSNWIRPRSWAGLAGRRSKLRELLDIGIAFVGPALAPDRFK